MYVFPQRIVLGQENITTSNISHQFPNQLRIGSSMTIGTRTNQARSLRNYRTCTLSGCYVASQARSLRSDRVSVPLVATYRPSVHSVRSLHSDRALPKCRYDTSPCILVYPSMLSPEDQAVINALSQKTAQGDLRHDSMPNLRFFNQLPVSRVTVYTWFARKDKCQGRRGKAETNLGASRQYRTQGLQPPENISSDLFHYAHDHPGHTGFLCHLAQVSK
ncbi:hypothetical protein IGI04_014664 [Brassica rapa subsp. trilocularis]|uniref:Homeobox domain-containing protein n=1 Tax=Brassica rapa subsp. trilocularis TaxID=1813537 RepID=A0ABQ7MMX2_BRACM|nr:hypothetical protein IGI04_014664 [Brassica rapa subsp. trilocularis]